MVLSRDRSIMSMPKSLMSGGMQTCGTYLGGKDQDGHGMDGVCLACRSSDAVQKVFIVTARLRSQVRVRHSSGQQGGRPSPSDLHQCFEREVDLRLSAGLVSRMVDLRLFVCAWLRLPWILPLNVCMNAPCAPLDIVFPMLSHAGVAEIEYFPLSVLLNAAVPDAKQRLGLVSPSLSLVCAHLLRAFEI